MIRILHAADLHLDSPFEGLRPQQAALRREEQRGLLDKLRALSEENGVQLLLLAGDLFDGQTVYSQTERKLASVLGALRIPVFIAPGNHDFYSARSPYARLSWPSNVHIFQQNRLECVTLEELSVRIWGAGYTDAFCPPLLASFQMKKDERYLDILLLHGEVTERESRYCPITGADLARSGFDYAALGHLHSFSGLRRSGNCYYAWPGCPQGRGFDETGEKGVILADVGPGRSVLRFLPTDTRRYVQLCVPAGEDAGAAILAALPAETKRDIYQITLTGECDRAPDLSLLSQQLSGRFFGLVLVDETAPGRDIWAEKGEESLQGTFLRGAWERLERAETPAERETVLQAVRLGLAALEGGDGGEW